MNFFSELMNYNDIASEQNRHGTYAAPRTSHLAAEPTLTILKVRIKTADSVFMNDEMIFLWLVISALWSTNEPHRTHRLVVRFYP